MEVDTSHTETKSFLNYFDKRKTKLSVIYDLIRSSYNESIDLLEILEDIKYMTTDIIDAIVECESLRAIKWIVHHDKTCVPYLMRELVINGSEISIDILKEMLVYCNCIIQGSSYALDGLLKAYYVSRPYKAFNKISLLFEHKVTPSFDVLQLILEQASTFNDINLISLLIRNGAKFDKLPERHLAQFGKDAHLLCLLMGLESEKSPLKRAFADGRLAERQVLKMIVNMY